MRIVVTRTYEREVSRLLSPDVRADAESAIVARPKHWPVIPGTGGARKARIALPGRGKRGGARVIYFFAVTDAVIIFFHIYAKNAKKDLTSAQKRDIKAGIVDLPSPPGRQ